MASGGNDRYDVVIVGAGNTALSAVLDGTRTEGIMPPFTGFVVTCGITFTFGWLRIDESCTVLDEADRAIPGLYAAGELVGGLFYQNYLGGAGLMAGSVFGRIAGTGAGRHAQAE